MKKLFATAIAAVMALSAASCSDKEKKEQIEVPIYEAAAMTYKTAKSEVSSISQKYIMDGKFSNPYSVPVKFTASGQIKEILVSSNQQVKKGQILCTLFTDDIDSMIEDKKAYVDQAKKTYSKLLAAYDGSNIYECEKARVELEIQQFEYDELVKRKEKYNVYAPCDGHYRAETSNWGVKLDKFVQVNQGTVIGNVTDESESYITCTMREQPLQNVNFGTHVDITQGEKSASGIVADIVKDKNDYIYVIRPEEGSDFSSLGEMKINFNIYSRSDVVVVPSDAVKTVGQRKFVNLLVDGVKVEQDVETGIVDGKNTEIVGGLIGGEEVIIS